MYVSIYHYISLYLCIYVSIYPSINSFIYASIYLFISNIIYLCTCLSTTSIFLSIYLCFGKFWCYRGYGGNAILSSVNYMPFSISIYLFIYISIYISIYLSIHLSTYLKPCMSIAISIRKSSHPNLNFCREEWRERESYLSVYRGMRRRREVVACSLVWSVIVPCTIIVHIHW